MSMGNEMMLVKRKNPQKIPYSQGEMHHSSQSTLHISQSTAPSQKLCLNKPKFCIKSHSTTKDECYAMLKTIDEPNIDLFSLFQKQSKTLKMLVTQTIKQKKQLDYIENSTGEGTKGSVVSSFSEDKQMSRQNSISPARNSPTNLSMMTSGVAQRDKRSFRCQPDFRKGLSCEVDYLEYIKIQAFEERRIFELKEVKRREDEESNVRGVDRKELKKAVQEKLVKQSSAMEVSEHVSCFKKYVKPISLFNLNTEVNGIQNKNNAKNSDSKANENSMDSLNNNQNKIPPISYIKSSLNNHSSPNFQVFLNNEINKTPSQALSKPELSFNQANLDSSPEPYTKAIDYDTGKITNRNNKEHNVDLSQQLLEDTITQTTQEQLFQEKDKQQQLQRQLKSVPSQHMTREGIQQLHKYEKTKQLKEKEETDLKTENQPQPNYSELSIKTVKEETKNPKLIGLQEHLRLELRSDEQAVWKNQVFKSWQDTYGIQDLYKKLKKRLKHHSSHMGLRSLNEGTNGSIGSKTLLSMKVNRAKKEVTHSSSPIRQYNSVGAFGYGIVLANPCIPDNDFFKPDLRFRIRLRHSNIQSNDDASSCPRETAIKFADQNEDGPLDLILHTGRVAKADCCNSLLQVINLSQPNKLADRCRKDPLFKFAMVDGTRRAPDSYTNLIYYSHLTYLFIPSHSCRPRLVKFRLIPASDYESGLLDEKEQKEPWFRQRNTKVDKSKTYLREEFQRRMSNIESVKYMLQMQITRRMEEISWNPQMIWDENESPWLDLMRIQLTTTIPFTTLSKTYFNIVDKPSCLKFRISKSANDFSSFQNCLSGMYTRFELDHMQNVVWRSDAALSRENIRKKRVQYYVTLCTAPSKDTKSMVDVYITLIGTKGRTAPQKLDYLLDENENDDASTPVSEEGCEQFVINTDSVGEILVVSLTVRHRHLTDEWFLMYLLLSDSERIRVRHFPCYNVVLSKVTLRPGEVSLPQKECHELLRQERLLELRDKKSEYQWFASCDMPFGWIGAETVRDLPMSDRLQAEKYAGMPWDVDPTALETLLPFLASAASRGLLPSIPLFHRQTSTSTDGFQSIGPMKRKMRNKNSNTPSSQAARKRWRKIRFAIAFITKVRIPDGPKGDMCRSVQDDVDFGRYFLLGPNPLLLKKVENNLPSNFNVTDDMCGGYLNIKQTLQMAIDDGNVYIIDYSILSDIPTIHKNADKRYLTAPLILFFEREFGDLIPLAIQLSQTPNLNNPIWTPNDYPEDWIMAKLWVKCADYHYHFAISHLLKSHFVVEPFAVGMMRQLSSSHPVYKLLKPHLRYTLVTNTLLRRHILRRNCAIDKYTSIGASGINRLMMKYLREKFVWDELDPRYDLASRGTLDAKKLPTYFYRDDALSLWDRITEYVNNMLNLFYIDNNDVEMDTELQAWVEDIYMHGFPGLFKNLSGWNTTEPKKKSADWHLSGFDEDEENDEENNNGDDDENNNGDDESVFTAPNDNESEAEVKTEEENTSNAKDKVRMSVSFEGKNNDNKDKTIKETSDSLQEDVAFKNNENINSESFMINKKVLISVKSSNSIRSSMLSSSSYSKSFISKISSLNRPLEDLNLPMKISTVEELCKLITKLIFTATCQHSATHTEALDLYGFIPIIPSMMRNPPMHRRKMTSREYITQTLPDQFPDAYYGSLSTLLQVHKPEENSLGDSSEMHFVEEDAKLVNEKFQNELKILTRKIEERSRLSGITYHNLTPTWIPNSVEPLPFLPKIAKEEAMTGNSSPNESSQIFMMTPSVPLSILPLCMYLARSNPARSGATKPSKSTGFNSGVDGVGVPKKTRDDNKSMQRQKFNNMF